MKSAAYIQFRPDQIEKIGNTLVYLAERVEQLSKTKLLKLLYIIDELSIKKSGIPALNLTYKLWKFGPVSEELFIELSSEPALLQKFIQKTEDTGIIRAKAAFDDAEFSDNDLMLMDEVIAHFGQKTARELVKYTHRLHAPWHQTALHYQVLELLESEQITNTSYEVDMSQLVAHDPEKLARYQDYLESM